MSLWSLYKNLRIRKDQEKSEKNISIHFSLKFISQIFWPRCDVYDAPQDKAIYETKFNICSGLWRVFSLSTFFSIRMKKFWGMKMRNVSYILLIVIYKESLWTTLFDQLNMHTASYSVTKVVQLYKIRWLKMALGYLLFGFFQRFVFWTSLYYLCICRWLPPMQFEYFSGVLPNMGIENGKCRWFRNSSACLKTHCAANNWPIWTQKVPKEA